MNFTEIEIHISDKDFLILAKKAHENNITFNFLCNTILKKQLIEIEKLPLTHVSYTIEELQNNYDEIMFSVMENTCIVDIYESKEDTKPSMVILSIEEYNKLINIGIK